MQDVGSEAAAAEDGAGGPPVELPDEPPDEPPVDLPVKPPVERPVELPDELSADVRQALQILRPGLDSAPMMITVTWGPDHRLAYQNAESVRLLGRRALGLPVVQAFPDMPPE